MRRVAEGFCLIYEKGKRSPIGELKESEVEPVVGRLWEKYGHRFHSSNPKSKRSRIDNDRLDELRWAIPAHALKPGAETTLCGGSIRQLNASFVDPASKGITCVFCLLRT